MSNTHSISFVLMGDEKFYHTIKFSIKKITEIYPSCNIYLYNRGFTEDQLKRFSQINNLQIVNRDLRFFDVDIKLVYPKTLRGYLMKVYKMFFNFGSFDNTVKYVKREMLYINKVLCFKHFLSNYGGKFVYLDGDAILVSRLDELLELDFDVGVTLRRLNELSFSVGNCQLLNAGVIFFLGEGDKNKKFISAWLRKISVTHEYLIEQSALSRIILDFNSEAFSEYYTKTVMDIDNEKISVMTLPGELYNYNRIDENFVLDQSIKVLHFKGGRHSEKTFQQLINLLGLIKK